MHTLWCQLRYALRGLARNPGLSAVVTVTLALGIGATTGVFSAVQAVLLRSLPYPEADRLVYAISTYKQGFPGLSAHDYFDYRDRSTSFESFGAHLEFNVSMPSTGGESPETVNVTYVSTELLGTLGVAPALGRGFSPEDGKPAPVVGPNEPQRLPPVAVISHGLWQRRFGGAPAAVGSALTLRGEPVTVVGVMPEGFRFMVDADVWLPLRLNGERATARRFHNWVAVGRLKPGETIERAQAELSAIATQLQAEYPDSNTDIGIRLSGLHAAFATTLRPQVLLLTAAVGLMLLIACGNVANLLLARGIARRSEIAMRVTLGATRRHLIGQLLTETTVLGVLGGILGLAVALAVQRLLSTALSLGGRRLGVGSLDLDALSLGFALGVSILTGLAVGLLPALRATRVSLFEELKGATRSATARNGARLRTALVASQVALSLVLLLGAALLVRSFDRLVRVELGFDPADVVTANLSLPATSESEELMQFYAGVLEELRAVPGVVGAGMVSRLPVLHGGGSTEVWAPERPGERSFSRQALGRVVLPGYFAAMRMPLLAGRDVSESDRDGAPLVIVISEAVATMLYPGESVVGRQIAADLGADEPTLLEVVGVVGSARLNQLDDGPSRVMYFPFHQIPVPSMYVAARAATDPQAVTRQLREIVWARNKDVPVAELATLAGAIRRSTLGSQTLAGTVTVFSLFALLLASLGLFGVLSYQVTQRRREIGIRIALGARRGDVLATVLRRGLAVAGAGAAAGAVAGLALTRLLRGLLFEVAPTDPASVLAAAGCLLGAAIVACLVPAARAMRIEPSRALRYE